MEANKHSDTASGCLHTGAPLCKYSGFLGADGQSGSASRTSQPAGTALWLRSSTARATTMNEGPAKQRFIACMCTGRTEVQGAARSHSN